MVYTSLCALIRAMRPSIGASTLPLRLLSPAGGGEGRGGIEEGKLDFVVDSCFNVMPAGEVPGWQGGELNDGRAHGCQHMAASIYVWHMRGPVLQLFSSEERCVLYMGVRCMGAWAHGKGVASNAPQLSCREASTTRRRCSNACWPCRCAMLLLLLLLPKCAELLAK